MMSHARTVQLEPKVEHDVINPSQNEFKSIVENAIREFKPGHASVFFPSREIKKFLLIMLFLFLEHLYLS